MRRAWPGKGTGSHEFDPGIGLGQVRRRDQRQNQHWRTGRADAFEQQLVKYRTSFGLSRRTELWSPTN
jgi:hypothetical protein